MNNRKPKYQIERTTVFRKDLKKAKKRGLDLNLMDKVVTALQCGEPLPEKNMMIKGAVTVLCTCSFFCVQYRETYFSSVTAQQPPHHPKRKPSANTEGLIIHDS